MSKEVDETFKALFALEDLREIWRKTAPKHELNKEQKEKVKEILEEIKKSLNEIEKCLK